MAPHTRIILPALVMLLLAGASAAATSAFFNEQPQEPASAMVTQVGIAMQILIPLMVVLVMVAAAAYAAGQFFGADTRARATVWAQGMLVAVGVSALIIISFYAVLPWFFAGNVPTDLDIVLIIAKLRTSVASLLVAMTAVLVILAAAVYVAGMLAGAETRARANVWASGLIAGAIFVAIVYVLLVEILPVLEGTLVGTSLGLYGAVIVNIAFFVACFILITYLVSKVFKVPEWEAYLNIELSSLLNSFVLVVFILGMFGAGTALALVVSGGTASSPPQAAISYMQATVVDSILTATIDVYKIQACTSILSTFSRRIGEFVLTQTYKVFPGLDTFVSVTNVLTFTLLSLYNSAKVQVILLYVSDALMVPFFLPAGLILRFFPPTRDAGAFLISLAFGFQVVFPMTYMMNKSILEDIHYRPYNAPGERPALLIQSLCGPFKYGVAGFLFNPAANPIYSMVPGGQAIGTALSRIVSEGLLNSVSMMEFIPILKHIGALSLLSIFMPALSLMLTIAFINAMAKFIVSKV
ncbi:hypothetical protein L0Y65_06450 [Candidatus Micrarchaeota archaeon]|nr:hypothetical protein [Candidatus Micrarchaeota archaeon]